MIPFEDFHLLPTADAETATRWILWHPRSGAYLLDAELEDDTGRLVALTLATGRLRWTSSVASLASISGPPEIMIQAPIPADAPAAGPDLLDLALAALRDAHGPTPLAFRPGRSRAGLEKVMRAAGRLASIRGRGHVFCQARCIFNPEIPISRDAIRHGRIESEWEIAFDISAWFGPYSRLQHVDSSTRPAKRNAPKEHAVLWIDQDTGEPSAHDKLEAVRVLTEFYAAAAADLGLTPADIEARLAFLGCETPASDDGARNDERAS